MINKEKTIRKMMGSFKEIYPIPGKKTLYECFFYLHGQHLFQFRTKDKKIHSVKACIEDSIVQKNILSIPFWDSIMKILTQPLKIGFIKG